MPKEFFYFLAIFCIVAGVRLTMILIRRIKHRRNSHRVQQVIAQYCEAAGQARLAGVRTEVEDVEKFTINMQSSAIVRPEVSPLPIKSVTSPISTGKPVSCAQGSYRNKRIISFQLLGNTYRPHTWKELLVLVSEEMYRRHGAEFSRSLSLRGSRTPYFSQEPDELNEPIQIAGSNFFVETKLKSNSIVKRSRELMGLFGYKKRDLQVSAE
jgi:hypothetical protein